MRVIDMSDILKAAGYHPEADGKFKLPPGQEVCDKAAAAALSMVPWKPGDPPPDDVLLTGFGTVPIYMAVAHALHGRVPALHYEAPSWPLTCIYSHKPKEASGGTPD